jgi:hypothetical protein
MKRVFLSLICAMCAMSFAHAQDAQQAAAEAAKTISEAPEVAPETVKPNYWTSSLMTNITAGQTSLNNWAAGGDNTVSFAGFVDGNANYAKNAMFWNNRLQLDYGFLYASSKPILQKSTDRIYLESKWGYKTEKMKNLYFSANYDFKSQFTTGYDYNTPESMVDADGNQLEGNALKQAWKDARALKSGFLAPAYTNLALGIDYKPTNWLSVNLAPITGGYVIVQDAALRKNYSMPLKSEYEGVDEADMPTDGSQYKSSRFELGAQMKVDAAVNVNDNFKYSTQVVLFYNYLAGTKTPRINWDNRVDWKLAKYFSLTLTTNMIYDDTIMITNPKDLEKFPDGRARVQFKQSLAFGFTYTIASKK